MTPSSLRDARRSLGLSQRGLASFLRMKGSHAGRTIRRWEAGDLDIPGYVDLVFSLLRQLPHDDTTLVDP